MDISIKFKIIILFIFGLLWIGSSYQAISAEKVSLQLRWDHQFQFAGYYAAKWQGYYQEANLDVEIRSAITQERKFLSTTKEVAEGRATFGVGAADILVANDRGSSLTVVAPIYQQSPVTVFVRKDTDYSSLIDLTRLKVRRFYDDMTDVEFQAILHAEGISSDAVKGVLSGRELGRSADLLAQKQIDAYVGFSLTGLWQAKQKGVSVTLIRPATYGVDFYGDALFTNRQLADDNPNLVKQFRDASLRGWQYALEHPKEISQRIAKELPRSFPIEDLLAFNLFQSEEIKLLTHYPFVQLGHINPARWQKMHSALKRGNLVKSNFDGKKLIFDPEESERERRNQLVQAGVLIVIFGIIVGVIIWIWTLRDSLVRRRLAENELKMARESLAHAFEERTAELIESEAKLKEAQSIAHVGSWSRNLKTGEYSLSEEEYKIFGLDPNGPPATYETFINIVHPDDRQSVLAAHKVYNYDIEYRIVRPSGEIRFIQANGSITRDENGEPTRMSGTVLDQTERKHTERQYHQVLTNLADGAITINTNGIIEYVNPMTETIFGYTADELIGNNVSLLMPSPDRQNHDKYLSNYLETGTSKIIGVGRQVNARHKDGTIFPVDLNISESTVEGKTTFFGTARDMTERVKTEEDLVQAKISAEMSNRVKGEFLANMSHELRTPLNAILGFSNSMIHHVFGELGHEKYEEYAIDINNSGQHLLDLISDILDVSAIEAGKLELSEAEFECDKVIESVIRLIKPRADEDNLQISTDFRINSLKLTADERRFKQIILNLLSNAVKFTPPGKFIQINLALSPDMGAEINIQDQGCGMSEEQIEIAMIPFGQVGNKREEILEGTGLGLPLTKTLIEAHGGTLKIKSQPNIGTSVTVQFPRDRVIHWENAS